MIIVMIVVVVVLVMMMMMMGGGGGDGGGSAADGDDDDNNYYDAPSPLPNPFFFSLLLPFLITSFFFTPFLSLSLTFTSSRLSSSSYPLFFASHLLSSRPLSSILVNQSSIASAAR